MDITAANLRTPEGDRCVLKGYETATMIGRPPAINAAAREAGKPPAPGPQAGWQVHLEFVVLSVVSPEGLQVQERP